LLYIWSRNTRTTNFYYVSRVSNSTLFQLCISTKY